MKRPAWHSHSESGFEIYGGKLEIGDILQECDVYDSGSGSWTRTMGAGEKFGIEHTEFVYVRPSVPALDVASTVREAFAELTKASGEEFAVRHIEDIATRVAKKLGAK